VSEETDTPVEPAPSKGSTSNGAADDDERGRYLERHEAAEFLGVALPQFAKYENQKVIKKTLHPRTRRPCYDRRELEAFATSPRDDEGANAPRGELLRALGILRDAAEGAYKQSREMRTVEIGGMRMLLEAYRLEVANLRTRAGELETKLNASVDEREKATQAVHEREIMRMQYLAAEKRKEEAWTRVLEWGPVLAEQISGTHIVKRLIESIGPEQFEAMTDEAVAFFTPKQRELIGLAREKFMRAKKTESAVREKQAERDEAKAAATAAAESQATTVPPKTVVRKKGKKDGKKVDVRGPGRRGKERARASVRGRGRG
jgi:hypothetical protein